MNYKQAVDYLLSFTDYEKIPSFLYSPADFELRRMRELLAGLGDPHRGIPAIHVAGTKGKGSTAVMVASALTAAGYRTGLYTSPHLFSLRERIQLDGNPIPEEELAQMVERMRGIVEGLSSRASLTTFEVLTAMAFLYFQEEQAQAQVLEVGLGGRLDATNLIHPLVAVITPISLDHTSLLGNTEAEIAREKGGIIKEGIPVVCSPQPPQALEAIREICREKGARLIPVGEEISWKGEREDLKGQHLRVKGKQGDYSFFLPLLGDYQGENAATAIATLEALMPFFPRLTPRRIARGLSKVSWPGRFQVLRENPWVVVDGAHNAYSAHRLHQAVADYFPGRPLTLVFGTSVDKDIAGIVAELSSLPQKVILTTSQHPRAAPLEKLIEAWGKTTLLLETTPSVPEAVEKALAQAGEGGLILVTGSLFVVAEAIEYARASGWRR